MDIEGEFSVMKQSIAFELDTWADAEKAKITEAAGHARKALEGPEREPTWEELLANNMSNHRPPDQSWMLQQQMYGPYGNPNYDQSPFSALMGNAFGWSRCQCCGR